MKTLFIAGILTAVIPGLAISQIKETKLIASDGKRDDGFGASVACAEDYAVIGAPAKGAAYFFSRTQSGWTEDTVFVAGEGSAFGNSVSLNGDYVIIGSANAFGANGAAYVFKHTQNGWIMEAILTANDGVPRDFLGSSVSLSGDYAIVGARGFRTLQGAAYIYKRTAAGWTQQAKLTASDGVSPDAFGWHASISGDYAIVGSIGKDNRKGAAYIFERVQDNWIELTKLTAPDGVAGDEFGTVSIFGDYAIVGALLKDNLKGAAYIYKRTATGWIFQNKLATTDENARAFGGSVSISDTYALVGADYTALFTGTAYLFAITESGWREIAKLAASDHQALFRFGTAVSLSGNSAIVGSISGKGNEDFSGSAYVYDGLSMPVSVKDKSKALMDGYALKQNYPNPFNPSTQIVFSLPSAQNVTIKIFSLTGKEVATLLKDEYKAAGSHTLVFDASNLPSGVYFYQLSAGEFSVAKKMLLVR
jgi:hypothetical protein